MNAATLACAPSGVAWHDINWADVHRQVRGLQTRIVKATQEVKPGAERRLCRDLSRVQGNLHARFLGGDGAAMRCLYPTVFHFFDITSFLRTDQAHVRLQISIIGALIRMDSGLPIDDTGRDSEQQQDIQ
jgi:hypothetical protein